MLSFVPSLQHSCKAKSLPGIEVLVLGCLGGLIAPGHPVSAGKVKAGRQVCWGDFSKRDGSERQLWIPVSLHAVGPRWGWLWSLLRGSAKKQPEDCPWSPPSSAFWGQEPHGAFLAAPTACLGEGSLSGKCVFLRWVMESNPTSTLGIGYPILCAYFCLVVDIFPDMGSWGSKKASHSSGLLSLGCG